MPISTHWIDQLWDYAHDAGFKLHIDRHTGPVRSSVNIGTRIGTVYTRFNWRKPRTWLKRWRREVGHIIAVDGFDKQ